MLTKMSIEIHVFINNEYMLTHFIYTINYI